MARSPLAILAGKAIVSKADVFIPARCPLINRPSVVAPQVSAGRFLNEESGSCASASTCQLQVDLPASPVP